MIVDAILSFLLVAGASFAFIGSLGLVKLPDFYMRLHGPTKATTLGIGCILGASIIYAAAANETFTLNEFLISIFLFITAPVSAHLLAKAALHAGIDDITGKVAANTSTCAASVSGPDSQQLVAAQLSADLHDEHREEDGEEHAKEENDEDCVDDSSTP